jgi:ribosomal protein S4
MFYAHKTPKKIISHRRTWIIIGRKKYVHRKKNLLMQKDAAIRRIASFYGFNNINKLKNLLFRANFSSKLRKFSALNLEGKVNIILYRLNIMNSLPVINKFIKRGRISVNGTVCVNPQYSLKLNDNLVIDFKVYKFVLGILKKRLKNKKI